MFACIYVACGIYWHGVVWIVNLRIQKHVRAHEDVCLSHGTGLGFRVTFSGVMRCPRLMSSEL